MRQTEMNDEQLQRKFQKNLPMVDAEQGWARLQAGLAEEAPPRATRVQRRRQRTMLAAVAAGACAVVVALVAAAVLGVFASGTQTASVDVTTGPTGDGPATVTTITGPVTETTGVPPATVEPVMTTSPWAVLSPSPEASEMAEAAISAWPAGVEMLVLSTGYELYIVDQAGVRWSQEMQTRPESATSASPTPFDGLAVSNNQQFVAYVDHANEIVVHSVGDGAEVSRVPYQAEGETQLRCLSPDGNLVALASVPPDLPKRTVGARLPWRVTVVDMRTGEATVEQPLEDLVKERTTADPQAAFTLYSLDWLPDGRLLVQYSGSGQSIYAYDTDTNAMEPIPGLGMVSVISDSGIVYGWAWGVDLKGPRPVVWDGSVTVALELDSESAYALGGAFNQAGDALAIQVMSSTHQPRGWQLFRLSEGHWQPSGPLAENSWMKAAPLALDEKAAMAWTVLDGGNLGADAEVAILSYDFRLGTWQEWIGPENLRARLGRYRVEAIIPAAESPLAD